jgi:hypothetical protein
LPRLDFGARVGSVRRIDAEGGRVASTNDPAGKGSENGGVPGYLTYLPAAWLSVTMLLALNGILGAWPLLADYRLPESALALIHATLAAGVVTLGWGLYVLGLAYNRSRRFPRHFVGWQSAMIAWLVARELYLLATPDFLFMPSALAMTGAEIAAGLFCIHVVLRDRGAAGFYSNPETATPPLLVSAIAAVLGVLVGALAGAGLGLLVGVAFVTFSAMSCFEGACGYFAFFLGLFGLLVGAIVGGIVAVWRTNRRPRRAA